MISVPKFDKINFENKLVLEFGKFCKAYPQFVLIISFGFLFTENPKTSGLA